MKLHNISLLCATLIFAISIPRFHLIEAFGFTIDLIHRASLQSPSSEHVKVALQRSFNRAKTLIQDHSISSLSTDIVADTGEYLMRFSLGTPPVEILAIVDTGSNLTWIQCNPCNNYFEQTAPIFEPKHSSTYKPLSCASKSCYTLPITSCTDTKGSCNYTTTYSDRSSSRGELAEETITLGNFSIPKIVVGCGHVNNVILGPSASGIIGLGDGQLSLVRQMEPSIQGKFSYCLVPDLGNEVSGQSTMSFGDHAVVSGRGVVTMPIVTKWLTTFYFLTLKGMTVGTERFDLVPSSSADVMGSESDPITSPGFESDPITSPSSEDGNIVIDSGTMLTFLPLYLYHKVEMAVRKQMSLKEISDPDGLLNLCYLPTGNSWKVPEITVHFKGGDVKLKDVNIFIKTSAGYMCFAFAPATIVAIYGNVAQMDFLVGFDLVKKTVSFKPTDCSKV